MENADAQPTPDEASEVASHWQCCFCGQTIRERSAEVAITHSDGEGQGLRAHIRCLKDRLHPSVPFLDPDDEATSTA
jgi:hypothetical protein